MNQLAPRSPIINLMDYILSVARLLGVLRLLLCLGVVFVTVLAPLAGDDVFYSGWQMVPTLVAPAVMPIFFFIILLDTMMCLVYRLDNTGNERRRLIWIVRIELALLVVMILAWLPAFHRLLGGN